MHVNWKFYEDSTIFTTGKWNVQKNFPILIVFLPIYCTPAPMRNDDSVLQVASFTFIVALCKSLEISRSDEIISGCIVCRSVCNAAVQYCLFVNVNWFHGTWYPYVPFHLIQCSFLLFYWLFDSITGIMFVLFAWNCSDWPEGCRGRLATI